MESTAERWNETYPDRPIELQAETLGCDDLHNNLTISLQSGTGAPDIVDIEIAWYAYMNEGNVVAIAVPLWYLNRFTDYMPDLDGKMAVRAMPVWEVGGFSMFAEAYPLFNSARTPGDIGATIVSYMYAQGFNRNNFGLASAAGIVLLLTVMILNVIQLKFAGMLDKEGD